MKLFLTSIAAFAVVLTPQAAKAVGSPPPQPDPAPQACMFGWCPIPHTHPYFIVTRLPGHTGMWRCLVTKKPTMLCEKIG